ncbi:DNA-directed RNA polymerase III, subunit Rpc31 [Phyllosticta capitalensis]|uniref:DNA-directed RNA polymerase III subunit n=1 Tax=Phyllosticta capitalensis TaxID=121624 RepID=A0ABR1Z4C4_9PEZI
MPPKMGFFPGGGAGRGAGKIAGVDVPWEVDHDLKIDHKPSELFPPKPAPIAPPARRYEKATVARYRALRERIHEGPLYTVLGDTSRVGKGRGQATAASNSNPFESMPTYTQKYKKQRRTIPRLDTRPYIMRFFPTELWTTLDPAMREGADAERRNKRKKLKIALSTRLSRLEQLEEDGNLGHDDDDELAKGDDDDAPPEEEEQDVDFEEDEDDDDDYNAENYFSNGEEEDYGDEDGGGGGEWD